MRNENRGEYPRNWRRIVRRVAELHGHRCERCGHPSPAIAAKLLGRPDAWCDEKCRHKWDGKQRVLTVHHLDGDKSNCHLWNLAYLCQVCHLVVQGRLVWDQGWMFAPGVSPEMAMDADSRFWSGWIDWHWRRYQRWRDRRARLRRGLDSQAQVV